MQNIPNFWILCGLTLVVGMTGSLTIPFSAVYLLTERHVAGSTFGIYLTIIAVSSIIGGREIGRRASSALASKALIIYTLVIAFVGFLYIPHSKGNLICLYLAALLVGMGQVALPLSFGLSRRLFTHLPSADIPFANAVLRAFFSLAWVGGPPLGGWASSQWGYVAVFYLAAGLAAFGIVLVLCINLRASLGDTSGTHRSGFDRRKGHSSNSGRLLFLSFLFWNVASMLSANALPLVLTQELKATTDSIGLVLGFCAVLEIPLMIAVGLGTRRVPLIVIAGIGMVFSVIYYTSILATSSVSTIFMLQVFCAAGVSATLGVGLTIFQNVFTGTEEENSSMYSATFSIASLVCGGIFGWVIEHMTTAKASFSICVVFATGGAMALFIANRQGSVAEK